MQVLIDSGMRILESMFAIGLVVSGLAMVLGFVDDIGTSWAGE